MVIKMKYDKVMRFSEEQKAGLKDIQNQINHNGGHVSINQLIRDSVEIFLIKYREKAIEKYSGFYSVKRDDSNGR